MHKPGARLIGLTQPAPGLEFTTAEDMLVYIAKVSNPKQQANFKTAGRLLKYLLEHAHYSPFEMVNVVVEVITTRDIGRQLLRHSTLRVQEFSQRYADPTKNLGFMVREARLQDPKNRQNSLEIDDPELAQEFEDRQLVHIAAAEEHYRWAESRGIALEQARVFLPEGNTLSRIYVNGNLRSWIHYAAPILGVRSGYGTQKEHIEVAKACWEVVAANFPMIADALEAQKEQD